MSSLEFDLHATVRATICSELYDVIKVLRVGTELSPVHPLNGCNPSDHFRTYRLSLVGPAGTFDRWSLLSHCHLT